MIELGDLGEEVDTKLRSTLDCVLDVVDPTKLEGLSERDKRLVAFSQELMTQCYVNDVQRDQDCEDDASRSRSFHNRSQESQEIPSFFTARGMVGSFTLAPPVVAENLHVPIGLWPWRRPLAW